MLKWIKDKWPHLTAEQHYYVYKEGVYGAVKYTFDAVKRLETK